MRGRQSRVTTPFHTYVYRLLHRYNPFREEVGLRRIGNARPDSPVLVSGNYAATVDRLLDVLDGQDCWLLVADSAGINVWCAAGVGDFNENKVVDAIVATKLAEQVTTRRLIFPMLAAGGIDVRKLKTDTGFQAVWGPTHLDDLPEFLRAGCRRTDNMRLARFPQLDRVENAIGFTGVFAFVLLLLPLSMRKVGWFYFSLCHAIFGTLLGYDYLPPKYPANKAMFVGAIQALLLIIVRPERKNFPLWQKIALGLLAHVLIAIDMIGSTPFYKTTIVHWLQSGDNESLFQPALNEFCTSCGACQEVCPKGLFSRDRAKKIMIDLTKGCCECLACVKQCPHQAISNVGIGFKDDIKSLDPATVSRFKANQKKSDEPKD